MKNNYGNYVVQKALKLAKDVNKNKLINSIVKNIDKIGDRKLILKWQSIINSFIEANCYEDNVSNCNYKKVFNTVVYKIKNNNNLPFDLKKSSGKTIMGNYLFN